ncbi:tail fiber protein [Cronobacter sakazakii]|uniref:tail fiber protein n=1 Tax=Cronobacter sakazakii TaxID=28141 RepID=UPI000DA180E6|nr:tail fiber protein [Cronobacter sakazakii]EKY1907437.1 tail fiber protein [Cronobacter sakazakii]ELY5800600.1 tail fiber protein [Cronobacter sakazakii]ELY6426311.1 tail fiber protein [Cronobacter sakazakii]MBF4936614.1 tail fiber protein [Cronobacter sakazakii]
MSAGTLTLTNKSAAVSGTGTSFTTELKAGDFIVVKIGGTPYTLPVKTITSNTQLTLVSNYTGPTQSGVAWFAVPQEAQSLITASLASQTAEALRGLNLDKTNWQRMFSGAGNITVTLSDGSSWTGPSLNSIKDMVDALSPVGSMLVWPSLNLPDNSTLGIKYLRLNGASFDKTLYPKLASIYTTGVLPDMRANVVRGFDDGRGVDQGRAMLSEQLDAAPNIVGSFAPSVDSRGFGTGAITCAGGVAAAYTITSDTTFLRSVTATIDASKSSPSYGRGNSAEVRMRNIVWNMIVRAS